MIVNAVFAFLHFVLAFGVFSTLFFQWLTLGRTPTYREATRLQACDRGYGSFAAGLLVVGLLRVCYFEKGSDYYFSSFFFWAKLTLFVAVGLLSIYPTLQFISWRNETKHNRAPVLTDKQFSTLTIVLRLELLALLAILLCASLMAKGISP